MAIDTPARAERAALGAAVRDLVAQIRASSTPGGAQGTPAQRTQLLAYRVQATELLELDLGAREPGVQRLANGLASYIAGLAGIDPAPGGEDETPFGAIHYPIIL